MAVILSRGNELSMLISEKLYGRSGMIIDNLKFHCFGLSGQVSAFEFI